MVADLKLESIKVKPGRAAGLAERDARSRLGLTGKTEAATLHTELLGRMQVLAKPPLGRAASQPASGAPGDGRIREGRHHPAVFSGINPQGCRVTSFKAPEGKEVGHDYLWRVHAVSPAHGEIGIFNRSHYEDVLAVRVRNLVPESAWRLRYRHIREFERMLVHEGTTVVKVFLHISFDEQRERLQARIDNPEKRWKFRMADLDDRAHWDAYRKAYEETITETSTAWAPWYVIPADRKWVRNAAVSQLLVDVLEAMDPRIPEPEQGIEGVVVT